MQLGYYKFKNKIQETCKAEHENKHTNRLLFKFYVDWD